VEKPSKENVKTFLRVGPWWIQTAFMIGTVLFSVGVLYNDVSTVKAKVKGLNNIERKVDVLNYQSVESNRERVQIRLAIKGLTLAVNNLTLSVAKLQVKLDDKNK